MWIGLDRDELTRTGGGNGLPAPLSPSWLITGPPWNSFLNSVFTPPVYPAWTNQTH